MPRQLHGQPTGIGGKRTAAVSGKNKRERFVYGTENKIER